MPYKISVDERLEIIEVHVWGLTSKDEHYEAQIKAMQLSEEKGWDKLLINLHDLETEGITTTMGCFNFGEDLSRRATSNQIQIAHVLPKDSKASSDVKFISTVAINRGVVSGEFKTIDEAKKWLLEFE